MDCDRAIKKTDEPFKVYRSDVDGGVSSSLVQVMSEPVDPVKEHEQPVHVPCHDDEDKGGPSFQEGLDFVKEDPEDLQLEADEGKKSDAKMSSSSSGVAIEMYGPDVANALVNPESCQNEKCQEERLALRRQVQALKAEIKNKDEMIAKLEGSSAKDTGRQDECMMTPEQFQKLLKERKEVAKIIKCEADGRRLEGLRQINDMKSRNGVHPFDYFPEEIWAVILEKLPPTDRANIYQVHDVFRNLLEPSRIQNILFPLVMNYELPIIKKVCYGRRLRRQVFLLNKLLRLRSVSKSFRDSIDAWIEQDILSAMKTAEQKDSRCFRDKIFYISDNKSVLNKMRRFSKNQRLVPRALKISLVDRRMAYPSSSDSEDEEPRRLRYSLSDLEEEDDANLPRNNGDDDDDSLSSSSDPDEEPNPPPRGFQEFFVNFKETIKELLERVGDQILRFELDCSFAELSYTQLYIVLREWLLLMPNMKWFSLGGISYIVPEHQNRARGQMKVVDTATLETLEMPTLAALERVDLHVRYGIHNDFSLCDAILIANPQVKIHNFYGKHGQFERVTSPAVLLLSLEAAEVGLENRTLDLPLLDNISQSNWKLKRLTLLMSARNESIFESFKCLERFPLLEDVSLRLSYITIGGHPQYLKLPNLKKFKVWFGQGMRIKCEKGFTFIFSLQFLLRCEKLEELNWNNVGLDMDVMRRKIASMEGSNQALVDFKAGLFDLSGSNIWDVFPRLGCITIRFQESGREEKTQYFAREYRKMVSSEQ